MGLSASIYEAKGSTNCSNGGISSRARGVCIVNAEGPFEPRPDEPAVMLIQGAYRGTCIAVPAVKSGDKWEPARDRKRIGPMAGGCYIASCDSRFGALVRKIVGGEFYGAVPLHDRFDTQEQYDANFD